MSMSPTERQHSVLAVMCYRRFDTSKHLALEFDVSIRTIYTDIAVLSCSYPIETVRGHGGGVRILDGWYPKNIKTLNMEQIAVLMEARDFFTGHKVDTLNSILALFDP